MPLDHLEFIRRQQDRNRIISDKPLPPWRVLLMSSLVTAIYVMICVGIAIHFQLDKVVVTLAGAAFVITSILVFWAQRYFHTLKEQEKERRLIREVLEGSRGARLITNSVDNAVYYNQRFEKICSDFGKPNLESLAQLFIQNNDAYRLFEKLSEQARRGLRDSMELRSGEGAQERWYHVAAQPVAGWAGYVHWRIDDITRQRDLDRSIREEREKLIDFTDNAPVGFFSVDENGRFIFVNATLARWLGNDIDSLLKKGTLHTYLEHPPSYGGPYDIVDNGGPRQVVELKMKGPAGTTFLASVNQTVVKEESGRVRTRGVVHDLTSEREMRQALKASEDRFQRFFDEAPVGVVLVGPDGIIRDCNNAFANLLGRKIEDIETNSLGGFLIEDDAPQVLDTISNIEQGEKLSAPLEVALFGDNNKVPLMLPMF